jgi:hypothetical protein
MKETPMRRITATSSLNEISTDQLGNRLGMRGECVTPPVPHPFLQQASGQLFEDDVDGFSSTSEIRFMPAAQRFSAGSRYIFLFE